MKKTISGKVASAERPPRQMTAVLLTGHGGYDKLEVREDVPVPVAGRGEVVIRVRAAGVNNTDINTRIGWYSKAIKGSTAEGASGGLRSTSESDAAWSGTALSFPRIQGADCCGHIVAVGEAVEPSRI